MVSVERVMREIEDDLRRERRTRLLAKGAPAEYRDPETYAIVERVLRKAIEGREHDAVLLPELISDDEEWRLQTHLTFSSHRPIVGPVIIFFKRRVLLPLTRWLFEYSLENFRRQQRVNRILFACIEELAIENSKLQDRIAGLQDSRIAERKG